MPTTAPAVSADPKAKQRLRDVLESQESFGTSLLAIVLDNYDTEAFEWGGDALLMQLKDDFNATLPTLNVDKLFGLIACMTTNQFYMSWEFFSQVCSALNGDEADFADFYPVDPEDIAWGVTEVLLNDPPDAENGTGEFAPEVATYAGVIFENNGIWTVPSFLDWIEFTRANPATSADAAFTDDPAMFSAVMSMQSNNAEYLSTYVKRKMTALKAELQSLPLRNRRKEQ